MESPEPDNGLLVYEGAALKYLGSEVKDGVETARLGGYLVVFTGPDDTDLVGDYFTKETDFGTISLAGAAQVPAYYQHGMDSHFAGKALGLAEVKLSDDEFGVWAEYQIEMRTQYERHLVELAKAGKMGQSSGAVGHLVERKAVGEVNHITRWPIGEASLTPTPAEPKTSAVPIKQFKPENIWPTETITIKLDTDALRGTTMETPQTTPQVQPEAVAKMVADALDAREAEATAAKAAADLEAKRVDDITEQVKANLTKFQPQLFNINEKTKLGDDETKAIANFVRTGDAGAIKASNATDMNITTAADGGYAVPTGHYQGIIARRDESMLNVGVMNIPGKGTTVNVPVDAEDDGEFVSTSEGSDHDRDSPALGTVAMTLVRYTKKIPISWELLEDEDSRLMEFLNNFVGRGMAKTHNSLLVTEVNTNGSALKTTTSATVLAAGELEAAVYGNNVAHYLGEGTGGANWVMQPATYAPILSLAGSERLYAPHAQGAVGGPDILGYKVNFSNKVEVYGTSTKKFALFGNFSYVGRREAPSFQFLRDPYSYEAGIELRYQFRTVYKVLQAEAVGYIKHA